MISNGSKLRQRAYVAKGLKMQKISICVYCGSRNGSRPEYAQAAETLGKGIAKHAWKLVYGAGDVGLMGSVARAAETYGTNTFGVIPTHLLQAEVGKTNLTKFIITENMHERKKVMFMNSDAMVLLPGGVGSLDEFFEVLTWAQLRLHQKPIVIVNVKEVWSPLINLIDHIIAHGFADSSLRALFEVTETAEQALDYLSERLR